MKTWFAVLACVVVVGCNAKPKTEIAHFVAVADRGVATNRDPWCADSDEPTPSDCEVPRSLVLPIPDSKTDSAVSMLKVRVSGCTDHAAGPNLAGRKGTQPRFTA